MCHDKPMYGVWSCSTIGYRRGSGTRGGGVAREGEDIGA